MMVPKTIRGSSWVGLDTCGSSLECGIVGMPYHLRHIGCTPIFWHQDDRRWLRLSPIRRSSESKVLPTLNLQTNWIDIDKSVPKTIKTHDTTRNGWEDDDPIGSLGQFWLSQEGVSFVQWSNFFGGQLTQAQRGLHLSVKPQFNLASKYVRIYRNVDVICWICSYWLIIV